jgi:hypothetical protein
VEQPSLCHLANDLRRNIYPLGSCIMQRLLNEEVWLEVRQLMLAKVVP